MPERSVYTEAVLELAEELRRLREEAENAHPIPFMQEKVSRSTERGRLERMTPQERAAWLEENGVESAMMLLRRKGKTNG